MGKREMSKEYLLEQLDHLRKGSYRRIDPQLFSGRDAELAAMLNSFADEHRTRHSYEQLLQDARLRLEKLLQEAPIGICITDRHGIYEEVNPAYCRIYGYTREELIGQPFTLVVPNENREKMQELHDRFMGRRYELYGEWRVLHRDGSPLVIMASAAYIIAEDGEPKKFTFVVDITDRKHYEEELNRTVDALQREIEERTRLEETRKRVEQLVRHDLKNPLSSILGIAQLMEEECTKDEQRTLVGMINDAGYRLLGLLNGMFDYMLMEEGRYELNPERIELQELLRMVDTGLRGLRSSREVGLAVYIDGVEIERSTPFYFAAAREHLQTLLENLLRNAVEASPAGTAVTVSVRTGDTVRFDIHNPGTVPREVRDKFFEQYATAGKERGTGMGTYIARLICEAHGGSISFTTGEEEGTHVYTELPARRDEAEKR
jgi:PAS domain S-box-containing protein